MLDKQADRRNRVRQRDNTKEASISKDPDPQGPFATERFLMPSVTGWTPQGLVGDTEEDAVASR